MLREIKSQLIEKMTRKQILCFPKTQSYIFDGRYEGVPRSVILLEDGTYAQITGWDLGIHPSFCAVYPLGLKRNNKDVYGVSIFVQMTEKDLKEFQDASKL